MACKQTLTQFFECHLLNKRRDSWVVSGLGRAQDETHPRTLLGRGAGGDTPARSPAIEMLAVIHRRKRWCASNPHRVGRWRCRRRAKSSLASDETAIRLSGA